MKKCFALIFSALAFTACSLSSTTDNALSNVNGIEEESYVRDISSSVQDSSETSKSTTPITTTIKAEDTVKETTIVENSDKIIPFECYNDMYEKNYISYNNIDDDICVLLKKAAYVYYTYFLEVNEETFQYDKEVNLLFESKAFGFEYESEYALTGISYGSFREYILGIFTENFTKIELLGDETKKPHYLLDNSHSIYQNYNGELCYYTSFGYVRDTCFDNIEFDISEQTDDKITIVGTAHYSDPNDKSIQWEYAYDYNIVLTENGWRVDSFTNWD